MRLNKYIQGQIDTRTHTHTHTYTHTQTHMRTRMRAHTQAHARTHTHTHTHTGTRMRAHTQAHTNTHTHTHTHTDTHRHRHEHKAQTGVALDRSTLHQRRSQQVGSGQPAIKPTPSSDWRSVPPGGRCCVSTLQPAASAGLAESAAPAASFSIYPVHWPALTLSTGLLEVVCPGEGRRWARHSD